MKIFKNPLKLQKCEKCGTNYDAVRESCPHCGTLNSSRADSTPFSEMCPLGFWREVALFLTGLVGFQLIAFIIEIIVLYSTKQGLINTGLTGDALTDALKTATGTGSFLAAVNYSSYFILLLILLLIVWKDITRLFSVFKKPKTYLGIPIGIFLIFVSAIWGAIATKLGATTNENETAVEKMIAFSPFLSIIVTGFVAPFCEELAYRVGLFGGAKRVNRVLAYLLVSVIFGLIHMHDFTSANEWLSYPDYVIAGLVLAYTYEQYGFGASFLAHATNNIFAVLATIISLQGK